MRIIDAAALAKFIDYGHLNNPDEKLYSENDIREMIDMMPTVDAIPVEYITRYQKTCDGDLAMALEDLKASWQIVGPTRKPKR